MNHLWAASEPGSHLSHLVFASHEELFLNWVLLGLKQLLASGLVCPPLPSDSNLLVLTSQQNRFHLQT